MEHQCILDDFDSAGDRCCRAVRHCTALRISLLARFENTTLGILRTSFAVGVRYLFCTLLMAFIYAVMGWITVCVFAPAFLLGMGLCAMLCSFLLVKIIHLIGGDPDAADEESHDEER